MRKLLQEKWRRWADAFASIDDPQGEYLDMLENRVRRLEAEVEDLRKRLSAGRPVSVQSEDLR